MGSPILMVDAALLLNPRDADIGNLYFVTVRHSKNALDLAYLVWADNRGEAGRVAVRHQGGRADITHQVRPDRPEVDAQLYERALEASETKTKPFIILTEAP